MSDVWSIDLLDSQKIVLLALADCANDEGQCWPSMATLAKKCSKSERTVQGVIKQLVDVGHLSREEIVGRGCKYVVHPVKIAPADASPPQPLRRRRERQKPPQPLRVTPAAAADKPSKNHNQPSDPCASDDARAVTPALIVDAWNRTAPKLGKPKVRDLTDSRRQLLKARAGQYSLIDFQEVFGKIERSAFLRGDTGWHGCTFDWVFKRGNFQKILEGNYDQ